MYHCHVKFYLVGDKNDIFDAIKKMSPFKNFSYEFLESAQPEEEFISKSDVIFAYLDGRDPKQTVSRLISCKADSTELIILAAREQIDQLSDVMSDIKDIWGLPISEQEAGFRMLRWQENLKVRSDLKETSHFLEAAINSSPNLIWYKDKNGIHEKVNDSFCKAVNKTKEQVQGRRHAYIWDVEYDDPACIKSEQEVMSRRKTCVSGETIQTGDGTRMLTTYKSPLYDLDGSVMGTVGVGIDVTKERTYEQELIAKNRSFERIFTSIDCGVLCHSIDGSRIISINSAALKILGYDTVEDLLADGFNMVADTIFEEDRQNLHNCINALKKEGDSISTEYRVRHKDGKVLHVMGNVKMLRENGELFYQRFLLDCTQQKTQEREKERHQFELVQGLSIDYNLVCTFDLDTGAGTSLRVNNCEYNLLAPIFEGETNISLEKSLGEYINNCVFEEDKEWMVKTCTCEWLKKELSSKNVTYINYRTMCGNELRYFQIKAVRTGSWENHHRIVLGFRSVDDEINSEIEKKNLLEAALADANRASEAKSVFLSNMSHDMRTPMNAIVGFTTLALSHIDNKAQVEEYLRKIMASGNHLLELINDVLDMSRIESGKMQLEEKPCNMHKIVRTLENIIHGDAKAKGLELSVDVIDVDDKGFFCDELRVNQILLNLLSNAIKYTNAGGRISFCVTEKPGAPDGFANYEFIIKDTGIGMNEEFVSHIFEPFERERNSTISGIQGTGLGMAITKNIVDMMNGSIEVKSKKDVGTECRVELTFRLNSEVKEQPDDEMQAIQNAVVNKVVDHHNERILLTEDNELNQEIAVAILSEIGFIVEVAGNGQEAVDMLKNSKPGYYRLVLMDVQMPVMNGYEAAMAIRAFDNEEIASIPILAMTANAFEEDKQKAIQSGMNGHIAKPIDIKNLIETIDKVLNT